MLHDGEGQSHHHQTSEKVAEKDGILSTGI